MNLRPLAMTVLLTSALCSAKAEILLKVSVDGEVTSLASARDRVRALRTTGEKGPIRVEFAAGRYGVEEPVAFGAEDSGMAAGVTSYAAAKGAKVVISGGRTIGGWQLVDGLWQARLPDPKWRFEQLWINGQRARVARTPNAGYFNAYSAAAGGMFEGMKDAKFEAFVARPRDFEELSKIPSGELGTVLLTVMQTWTVGQCRVQELNPAFNAVRIVGKARYPFVEYEPDQRWHLENYRAALDEAGEWYLSPEGVVLYMPRPGENLTTAEVIAPVAEKLLTLAGNADSPIHDVTFEGLTLQNTQSLYGPQGHHDGQGAAGVGAVIEVRDARNIRFKDLQIAHTGGYGVWFQDGCQDSGLTHSHLHDLGGGGVRIGTTAVPKEAQLTQRIIVEDCIIQHGGRRYPSACGVLLTHAADCCVTHNDISDLYYTGISAGWVWGYKPSLSKRNRFEFNHIHHLGWGVLSDMGGFYGLGRSEGTTVSNNHVHNIASYRYGGWGLYTDEGSTGVTMENNLVHDTSESTFHQHYGKWNQISNNIFAFGKKAQIQRSRAEKHASFAYERNIVVYDRGKLLDGTWYNWETGTYEMDHNLYWNVQGESVKFLDTDLEGWRKKSGRDLASVTADPLFTDVMKRDFHLKAESPALKLGSQPFDYTQAGVSGMEWRRIAAVAYVDFEERSQPWPQPEYELVENFEALPLGPPPVPRQELRTQNRGDSIAVAEDHAAAGKHSLKVTDAPGLDPTWDPHWVLKPNYLEGNLRLSFDLRVDEGSKFFIECRGEGNPYLSGPFIAYEKGRLSLRGNKQTIDIKPGAWTRLEIVAPLGSNAKGLWTLVVKREGEPEVRLPNLACDADWKELHWLGFVSTATDRTAFWLDNLEVRRLP